MTKYNSDYNEANPFKKCTLQELAPFKNFFGHKYLGISETISKIRDSGDSVPLHTYAVLYQSDLKYKDRF